MDDLSGSNHQIKLTIREGRNFENVPYPTIVIASLNNHSLETDLIQQDNNPQYLTDLIWEVQKKQLRTMRSAHAPIKIDCFALNEKGGREKLGYILLSIRTAQIIHKHEEVEIRFNWHTLSGLKGDLKSSKPELLLSLVIEEFANSEEMKKMNQKSLSYQSLTPVLLEHEHLIQLGPVDSCHDLFLITIMAGIVNNLDILIKESILNEQMEEVAIWSHILDNDIKLKPFKRSSERQWILNEKIVIRMRSSLAVLRNYFQARPYLLIFLKVKDHLVAQSKLDVRPLLFTDCLEEFVKKTQNASTSLEQQCTLLKEGEVLSAHEPKASISIKFKVQYVDKKFEQSHFPKIPPYTVPQKSQSAENNQRMKDSLPIRKNNFESHKNSAGDHRGNLLRSDIDFDNMLYHNQFSSLQNVFRANEELHFANDCTTNIESFHCYCLNVYLTGIRMFPNCPVIRNFEFRFHHPKAEIMSALHPSVPTMSGGRLVLQNIGCKLHFISSAEEIKNLLTSFPPRISVCDDNANAKICIAQTSLDVQRLFNQHKTECQYESMLVDADGNQIGVLEIFMNLEDHGPYYNDKTRQTTDNLGPPILDDSLVYKIVDELETWKEKQKEIFRIELQNKEEQYLNLLGEEWRKKKEALEAKLASNTEQCKMLANCLNNATEDLRIRRLKSHEKETRLIKANEEMKNQYEMKLQQLRSATEKMQDEFATKLAYFEECKTSYESQLNNLKGENEALRQQLKFQEERLVEYEKSLTPEQVTTLLNDVKTLEENLAKAEENKNYYKEQWAIVQEDLQELKTKYRQLLEVQIKSSKEEKINYEDILSANSEALLNDQIFLDQMQKKLDIMGPTKSSRLIINTETYASLNSVLSKPSHNLQSAEFSALNSEREAKINMLNQEKMDLIKTGTVQVDDPLIIKLDNQIKLLSAMI